MAHPRNAREKHESTANLQTDNGTRNLNMMECQDTAKVHLKSLGSMTTSMTTTTKTAAAAVEAAVTVAFVAMTAALMAAADTAAHCW